ncbi:MAG: GFA family protein [Desulfobacteraceae bacterium]
MDFGLEYASMGDADFTPKYKAACFCKTVRYEVSADPVDAKICHCMTCQRLHGAPMQWSAIFYKHQVRITAGLNHLVFYNEEQDKPERILPCKVRCGRYGTRVMEHQDGLPNWSGHKRGW